MAEKRYDRQGCLNQIADLEANNAKLRAELSRAMAALDDISRWCDGEEDIYNIMIRIQRRADHALKKLEARAEPTPRGTAGRDEAEGREGIK